jgi:hypothetical protein
MNYVLIVQFLFQVVRIKKVLNKEVYLLMQTPIESENRRLIKV